jgi:predicted membrane-bound mannosyltransferase
MGQTRESRARGGAVRGLLAAAVLVLAGCGAAGGAAPAAPVRTLAPGPSATPLTTHDWIVFTDNGVVEARTRFESFASRHTPVSEIEADIAYFEREIARVNAITPDPCWATMHARYLEIMTNNRDMLAAGLAGDSAGMKRHSDEAGQLNHDFTAAQEAVAATCT